jgi:hypothetical protein
MRTAILALAAPLSCAAPPAFAQLVSHPDAFIFLHGQKPTGPSLGIAFDHIGFALPDVPAMATRMAAAGYQ